MKNIQEEINKKVDEFLKKPQENWMDAFSKITGAKFVDCNPPKKKNIPNKKNKFNGLEM